MYGPSRSRTVAKVRLEIVGYIHEENVNTDTSSESALPMSKPPLPLNCTAEPNWPIDQVFPVPLKTALLPNPLTSFRVVPVFSSIARANICRFAPLARTLRVAEAVPPPAVHATLAVNLLTRSPTIAVLVKLQLEPVTVADPAPPRSLAHVTLEMLVPGQFAVPEIVTVLRFVTKLPVVLGDV